jgi:hypothetical protein
MVGRQDAHPRIDKTKTPARYDTRCFINDSRNGTCIFHGIDTRECAANEGLRTRRSSGCVSRIFTCGQAVMLSGWWIVQPRMS